MRRWVRESMKTLHLYLLRQVMATLVVTVSVFAFVLLLGNVLKDVLDLLASPQTTAGLLFQALGLLIPSFCPSHCRLEC